VVLSEKPLTGDAEELAAFERRHADASERVRVVNHFAFSPEVEWAVHQVAQRGLSEPTTVLCTFNDPYVMKSAAERSTYVSSWIDSGPNQLGLLARFVSSCVVRTHTTAPDGMRSITQLDHEGGSVVLVTNWMTGDSSKQTFLRWGDGLEIHLDHTAMTGVCLERGTPVAHFGSTGTTARKTAHYAAMYDRYLTDPSSHLLSLAFARTTAALLHSASSAPPTRSMNWHTSGDHANGGHRLPEGDGPLRASTIAQGRSPWLRE
jgi:predicted dehydrogenase